MRSGKRRNLCAVSMLLASFNASAALYAIQSSGIAPDLYLDESQAAGQFNSAGVLPSGSRLKNASVRFVFQDEADGLQHLDDSNPREIGDWVEQPPVYSGYDIHYIHLRDYYRIRSSLWRYARESVDVYLNGLRIGVAAPVATSTTSRTTTPVGWQWHHGGSSRYLYGYDSQDRPIFGTKYFDYYDDVVNIDQTTYLGNEVDFSLTSAVDAGLFPSLEGGGALDFALDATQGDLLFKSAALFLETFDEGAVSEPPALVLALAGLVGVGLLRRRRNEA